MLEGELLIINKLGLHARAAAKFVSCAGRYSSRIQVAREEQWVDAKSIMSVMMLAAGQGTRLRVKLEGDDAQQALEALEALVNDYFGEGE